jgi:PAS domain S-box-containing protein
VTDDLRSRAEHRARETSADPPGEAAALSPEESRLLHDLRVHQIELEMQNDELRQTQADLEASRARYFDLYDLAPVGYFTISEAGLILEANLTAATLLGVARGALVRLPLTRFVVPEDQDSYYLHRKRLFTTGAAQILDLRVRKEDGTEFWARLEATIALDTDGETRVCRAVVSDITERKRIEEERFQFEREIQQTQKVESLARMAGAIAHHFNNQLAVVMNNIELFMGEPALNAAYLADALRATQKAADVNGQLLTYLGQSPGSHAPLHLSETVGRGLLLLQAAMPKRVTLDTDLPAPGPAVNGNATQLQLMMSNLVTNAWEAAGDVEATIFLRITTVAGADIPASHRFAVGWQPRDETYACLEVTDTGCGIDEQEIEKIFDPFFTTKFTGRGLGLPVVLGILQAHSGGLVVQSRRGRESGSSFRVYLPISVERVTRPVVAPEAAELENIRWSGTVLLAEDEESLREVTHRALTRLGFTVLDAKDGIEALELFRRHADIIRLVLCDLTMPYMDGWETLTALRTLSPGVRVILTSGYDEADVMADADDEQPQVFLAKPYPLDRLRRAIGLALGAAKR